MLWQQQNEETTAVVDYGTTTTMALFFNNGQVINPFEDHKNGSILSAVIVKNGNLVHSISRGVIKGGTVIKNGKRLIGKSKADLNDSDIDKDIYGADIEFDEEDRPYFKVDIGSRNNPEYRAIYPEEIFRTILEVVVKAINDKAGKPVKTYCFTIPNSTTDRTKRIMRKIASELNLECKFLIKEPTAAGIKYTLPDIEGGVRDHDNVLVFDFGGGTLDLTIMHRKGCNYEVIAHGGNPFLGGINVDNLLVDEVLRLFKEFSDGNKDLFEDVREGPRYQRWKQRLLDRCREVKERLSYGGEQTIDLEGIGLGESEDIPIEITFESYRKIITPVMTKCQNEVRKIMALSRLTPRHIQHVLLVGGSSKIPFIKELFKNYHLLPVNDPQKVVVEGAMLANMYNITESYLVECMDCNIGCMVEGKFELHIPATTRLPTSVPYTYTLKSSSDSFDLDIYREVQSGVYSKEGTIHITDLPMENMWQGCTLSIRLYIDVSLDGTLSYEVKNNRTNELLAEAKIILN